MTPPPAPDQPQGLVIAEMREDLREGARAAEQLCKALARRSNPGNDELASAIGVVLLNQASIMSFLAAQQGAA